MSNTLFTSDSHLNHKNIIKFCNRPYSSAEEMNQDLEEKWNKRVSPKDVIWHLGDVMWGEFDLDRLNGEKHLIIGNHDNSNLLYRFFKSMKYYHELKGILSKSRALTLMHYPIESWNGKFHGAIHLHGHTHNTLDNTGLLRFDVGVDSWNMSPVSMDEILALVPQRKEEAKERVDAQAEIVKQRRDARDLEFEKLNRVADHEP